MLTRRFPFLDQQIGLILGRGEVLIVDTRSSPSQARELLAEVQQVTRDPITVVVNTHWHWDHAFGNSALRPAVIWGHERCRDRLLLEGEMQRREVIGDIVGEQPDLAVELETLPIDPPDRTLTIAADVEVGGRRVELRYLGRGHTNHDVVVDVPDADVLFAGDLLENASAPWFGDGYPIDWPATVERLLPLARGSVVPGHGPVADRVFVKTSLTAFRAVADAARGLLAGSLDRETALASIPYPPADAVEPLDRAIAQLRGELD